MTTAIPALDPTGWVTNKYDIIELCFKHFLASDQNQSNIFKDNISSLKYILAMHSKPEELRRGIVNNLKLLYESYFEYVDIDVTLRDEDNIIKVMIGGKLTDSNGKTYQLEKYIGVKNNEILI